LDAAKAAAHYVIAHFALNDWLPPVDFRSPASPVKRDSTAAMIASCGLLEIARHVGEYEKPLYTNAALAILGSGERAFADWNTKTDGIIGKGTGSYHGEPTDTEVALIYGDYFFIEAPIFIIGTPTVTKCH
jgi:unsaturated chondroitin disaccharide hydrolase